MSLSIYSSRSFSVCIFQNSGPRSARKSILQSHKIHSGFLRESVQQNLVSTSSLEVSDTSAYRLHFTSLRMSQLISLSNSSWRGSAANSQTAIRELEKLRWSKRVRSILYSPMAGICLCPCFCNPSGLSIAVLPTVKSATSCWLQIILLSSSS